MINSTFIHFHWQCLKQDVLLFLGIQMHRDRYAILLIVKCYEIYHAMVCMSKHDLTFAGKAFAFCGVQLYQYSHRSAGHLQYHRGFTFSFYVQVQYGLNWPRVWTFKVGCHISTCFICLSFLQKTLMRMYTYCNVAQENNTSSFYST